LCTAQQTVISLQSTNHEEIRFLCTAQKSLISCALHTLFFYFIGEMGRELLYAIKKLFQQESVVNAALYVAIKEVSHELHTNKRYQLQCALQNKMLQGNHISSL
jgi:hypothetical protein